MKDKTSGKMTRSRRSVLMTAGVGAGILGASPSRGEAQTTTTESGDQAQIGTRAIIPQVGEPFQGQYVGQYIIFTDPTPNEEVSPAIVGECNFAEWAQEETRGYQGLLIDRLTDQSRGVDIPMYLNGNKERVDVGNAFIIDQIERCSEEFIGVQLEDVPVSRFNPDYDTRENPLVGEEPGPTASPVPEGQTEGPGQPGFGAGTALAGVGAAALLKRFRENSSE